MLRSLLIMLLLALGVSTLSAQDSQKAQRKEVKRQLSTAKTNIKNGSNLQATEQSMRTLLEDSANVDNEKIWLLLFESIKKQHEQLNEKLYLKQPSDTAQFFTLILHLFDVLESMDTIDAKLKGASAAQPRYRSKHAAYLNPLRKNLYSGGGYYVKQMAYSDAYRFFDSYIDCSEQPLFANYSFDSKELSSAAFWAMFCGYKMGDAEKVLRYADLALSDTTKEMYILQYMAEAYSIENDTAAYHKILRRGSEKYIDSPYFFKHLAMFYSRNDEQDKVLDIAERVLAAYPSNVDAMVAKSSALFHKEKYAECVKLSDEIIELDPSILPPYANAGLAYYNLAVSLSDKKRKTPIDRQQLSELYRRALPYLEKFRQMAPQALSVWGIPLYNVYFNLNMGDEFDEMEKLLKAEEQATSNN